MPIYEYRCEACGEVFEKMVGLNAPVPACPACGAEQSRKLVSAPNFVLKGSGWYRDHYGLKKGGSSGGDGGSSGGSGSSGGDSGGSGGGSGGDGGGAASSSSGSATGAAK